MHAIMRAPLSLLCCAVFASCAVAQQSAKASPSPSQTLAMRKLATQQAVQGHYADSAQTFRNSLAKPGAPPLSDKDALTFATDLARLGQTQAAEDQLQSALTRSPNSAPLNDAQGTLLAQSGKLEAALDYFQRAVYIAPTFGLAQYHLGTALLALHHAPDAITPLRSAEAAIPNSFDVELQLGSALSATGQDEEALQHLHRSAELRIASTSPDALYALAMALQASGDAKGSLPLFEAATTSPNASANASGSAALTNYALAHVQTGDAIGALPLYARALALGPDTASLREDYGVAYLQQSDLDHALEQFHAGLALEPENAHLHYDLGLALKLKDNLTAAVPEFEKAAALDPQLPDPAYTLGVIYMQEGRYPEAIADLKRAAELQPKNGDAWALLGSVLKDSGDAAGALDALQHAIALEPDQPSLHIQVATLDIQAGKREEAAAERKIAAALSRAANNRQRASFALKSGRVLLDQNKLADAILQLHNAVEADPSSAEAHRLLAQAYTRQGKTEEAAAEQKRVTELASAPAAITHP